MRGRVNYQLVAAYDTETCNYLYKKGNGDVGRTAWAVCYQFLDLREVDVRAYEVGMGDLHIYRDESEALAYIEDLCKWGRRNRVVPVIAGYNLMFDMQTLMYDLAARYRIECIAQSSTHVYTLDLYRDKTSVKPLCRFWDTYYLEMRGLAAMGECAGVPKLYGSWDYNLIRTPETPLTDEEQAYAAQDVYIIPAYCRYLLESNSWMGAGDLACHVLTKTSIVRTFSRRELGNLKYTGEDGKSHSVYSAFTQLCAAEYYKDYDEYCLQRACFRGGFTFTAANYASREVHNVYSLDETSAHHFLINGRMIPVQFRMAAPDALAGAVRGVLNVSRDALLSRYDAPWLYGLHVRIRFKRLRMRRGSAFERWGIGLIPQGKFATVAAKRVYDGSDDSARNAAADTGVAKSGWVDRAINPTFAYSKLMAADSCELHLSEVELWAVSRVYEWDSWEVIAGEVSTKWILPPDYVTLQSNVLFAQKQGMKQVLKYYNEGEPYTREIDERIPEAVRAEIMSGTASRDFLQSYYQSTVKGMFNGIYGVQSQNVLRPDYMCDSGELVINPDTKLTAENFEERSPKKKKVLYTYGLRIVGGSRLQLVLAIELLFDRFGDAVRVVGGDTDSLKVSCDSTVTSADLLEALEPLHKATREAIQRTQRRVRDVFGEYCVDLSGVGEFEVENDKPYPAHVELWNKARVTWDGRRAHVTCAGLSRPRGLYTIEDAITDYVNAGHSLQEAANMCLGYNTWVDNSISHALERTQPKAASVVDLDVTDHTGAKRHVHGHEAICLYAGARNVADTTKRTNLYNVQWLRNNDYNPDIAEKVIRFEDGALVIERCGPDGWREERIEHA